MRLVVHCPADRPAARSYIVSTVLGRFLGLESELHFWPRDYTAITIPGQPGEVRIKDDLLALPQGLWLTEASLGGVERALRHHGTANPALRLATGVARPVGAGARDSEAPTLDVERDVFGLSFFFLTRYEEFVSEQSDAHGRMPAAHSLLARAGLLQQPVVCDYSAELGAALQSVWPWLRPRRQGYRVQPTHDVDSPYFFPRATPRKLASLALRSLRLGDPGAAATQVWNYARSSLGLASRDPFDTFDWLMSRSEAHGLQSTFFVMAMREALPPDGDYSLEDPRIGRLLRRISERGHRIGLHASYRAHDDARLLAEEQTRLLAALERAGVSPPAGALPCRSHFLRWRPGGTWPAQAGAGLARDYTMTFAGQPGFRCGTMWEFPVFDLASGQPLDLIECPTAAMDGSLRDEQYMGLSPVEAERLLQGLTDACRQHQGPLTLLWHNSFFVDQRDAQLYERTLAHACA